MAITTDMVKKLREATGAGVMDCRRALEQTEGNEAKARDILLQQGLARAEKRSGRVAAQGLIEAYVHGGGRIATLIELNCESDFVARNDDFRGLAHDIAMQVAATSPKYLSEEDIPAGAEVVSKEQEVLLLQPFIKDPGINIGDLIRQKIGIIGENIVLRRYVRMELGESLSGEKAE